MKSLTNYCIGVLVTAELRCLVLVKMKVVRVETNSMEINIKAAGSRSGRVSRNNCVRRRSSGNQASRPWRSSPRRPPLSAHSPTTDSCADVARKKNAEALLQDVTKISHFLKLSYARDLVRACLCNVSDIHTAFLFVLWKPITVAERGRDLIYQCLWLVLGNQWSALRLCGNKHVW
jgi:hypothetical protein